MNVLRLTFTVLLFLGINSYASENSTKEIKTVDTGNGDVQFWTYEK